MQQMSKFFAKAPFAKLSLALACGALSAGSAGCLSLLGADQGAVTVTRAELPQVVGGQNCAGNVPLANGVLDLQSGSGYTAALVMRTNLPATFNTQNLTQDRQRSPNYPGYGNVDTNVVQINRAYVYIDDGEVSAAPFNILDPTAPTQDRSVPGLPSQAVPRVSPATGVVFNEQTTLGNEATVFVPAITPQEAVNLEANAVGSALVDPSDRKLVVAKIVLEGVTSGAGYIRTNEYNHPIRLCRGCLVGGITCGNNQVMVGGGCAPIGQDLPAECQDVNAP